MSLLCSHDGLGLVAVSLELEAAGQPAEERYAERGVHARSEHLQRRLLDDERVSSDGEARAGAPEQRMAEARNSLEVAQETVDFGFGSSWRSLICR